MDHLPLTIAGADDALDQELSTRLSAFNADASGGGDPQELTVRVEAAARGARAITVSSFTFQAPEYYRRHGYVETTRVPDLPFAGHADVWFSKPLA